ncbi:MULTISPECIES: histidinol-phosphate transaminase [unclassified Variovorax]|uniref:histidinol-phosphate transaminase n=1 Tax=unclassified Variovorax TaxID=663243 RepID=UPI00076CAB98|nr:MULTISPECIES: histidinol-phosphate transaminase [unclassified Variovorax]KWT97136.1 Histidinol-phosphate aminotransferase [Variovorax sp. WDL1]PNG55630.1 Histidinol-phosphate aminotransferase [Variovorax sp. B4]PNG57054.1 Histidinol-phosphate aminotransferase [Variovorax sp. B2]VTV10649.1 Histidinol-phosphate aminotransferase [Variovorax sp. WDL1]
MSTAPSFWSPRIAALEPYVPGEQPRIAKLVKLNTNENPFGPSPQVLDAIESAAAEGLQRYPDPESMALCEAIAARQGLDGSQVFAGNGSDEVLAHAFFAFFQQSEPLLIPDVTYSFYRVYAQLYGIACELLPVDAGLRIDIPAMAARAATGCGGIVIANPNAPTGIGLPLGSIERLLEACPRHVVLVDEAYVDFGGESALPLIERHPNLLVVQTLSKSRSLAGLRVGFACGQAKLIEALQRVKNSFNSYPIDRLASAGAIAALADEAWFAHTRHQVMDIREGLTLQLEDLGFEVLPSQANFVFVRHPARDAAALASELRAHAVLVRHFDQPRIAQYLRISVGTREQCGVLVDALTEILR